MNKIKCVDCGEIAEVPFIPDGRPVYCRKCYQKHKPKGSKNSRNRKNIQIGRNKIGGRHPSVYTPYSDKFTPEMVEKMKSKINREALERSKMNNETVKEFSFYDSTGVWHNVEGNQLNILSETPRDPLLNCPYVSYDIVEIQTENETKNVAIGICNKNEKHERCKITEDKKEKGECIGKFDNPSSYEFYVISNSILSDGINDKEFKIGFFNRDISNGYAVKTIPNPIRIKAEHLHILYERMQAGLIMSSSVPKPGKNIFHTLFSEPQNVDILTKRAENIKGKLISYEWPPGHYPEIDIIPEDKNEKIRLQLYAVERMTCYDYKINDLLKAISLELLLNGHTAIVHPPNVIIDFCKASSGITQKININGDIDPKESLNEHDMEVSKIVAEVKESRKKM